MTVLEEKVSVYTAPIKVRMNGKRYEAAVLWHRDGEGEAW